MCAAKVSSVEVFGHKDRDFEINCSEPFDYSDTDDFSYQYQDPTIINAVSKRPNLDCLFDLDDCYASMRRQELKNVYHEGKTPYLKIRRLLIDWTSEIGEELQLTKSTTHTATMFLDRLLMFDKIPTREKLQLLSLCSLLIASKNEESEDQVPPLVEIWEMGNRKYSKKKILATEIEVLKGLNWSLSTLTPIHFTNFFLNRETFFPGDHILGEDVNEHVLAYYKRYITFFAELCLQEYSFQHFTASIVATSILYVSRKALCISPLWRLELTVLTGYQFCNIEDCCLSIWQYYVETFPQQACRGNDSSPTSVADMAG